ncbi:uncharacterized protein LOC135829376 [Sycon ciliatum]|uniref:uncharacterized protein LOC135829376 n=1 Tax=Sycon ciliatum TaxID=27933 RepID=UPI0031F69A1F
MSAGHIAAGVAPGQLELLDMAAVAIRDDAETESDKERRRTAPSSPRSTARHNPASAPEHAKSPRHKAFSIDDTNALDGSSLSRRSSASARSANGNGLNQGPSSNTRDADTPLSYEPTKAAIVEVSMPIGRQAGERSSIKMKLRALKNLTAQRSYDESDEESSAFLRERLNIRRLWCDVKDPKTPQSSDFQEEVRNLLRQQELDCLLPEDCLDETTAELDVFARLVYDRLGRNYNSALLLLTKHSWIEDKVTSLLLDRLISHNSKATSPQDEAFVAPDPRTGNTPLHQLARINYTESAHVLFRQYPQLWRIENKDGVLPLEVAFDNSCCKIAVKLMDDMPNDHVRDVFQKRRRFADILNDTKMTDATHAILDRLVAEWPDEEGEERGFDFYYQPLESDSKGRMPGDEGYNGMNSCFMAILRRKKLYQAFGNQRVVRMLLNAKWQSYGEKMLWISASAFFLFILVLTFATEMATSVADPTSYNNAGDYIRGFCEVVILLVLAALFLGEIIEMVESRHDCHGYWTDHYNLAQITSFTFLSIVVPLRYLDNDGQAQWVFLSVGYFITMARSFKFISTSSLLGVYTRVITGILARVMPKFIVVFAFVLVAWAGAWYPALRSHSRGLAVDNTTQTDIGLILETSSYWENIFLGVRVMIEGRNLIDYYNNKQQLGALSVFFYLLLLAFVALIMRTILIAQMAATYNTLNRDAVHQLEINRSWVLPSLEQASLFNGKFSPFGDWRSRYYNHKETISAKDLQKLLQEEKVDGFVHLERLMFRQKAEQDMKQLQLLQHIDHQTILEEKWNTGILEAVKNSRLELLEQSKRHHLTLVSHSNSAVAQVTGPVTGDHVTQDNTANQVVPATATVDSQPGGAWQAIHSQLKTQNERYDRLETLLLQLEGHLPSSAGTAGPQQQQHQQHQQSTQGALDTQSTGIASSHAADQELSLVKTLVQQQCTQLQDLRQSMQRLEQHNQELAQQLRSIHALGQVTMTTSTPSTDSETI